MHIINGMLCSNAIFEWEPFKNNIRSHHSINSLHQSYTMLTICDVNWWLMSSIVSRWLICNGENEKWCKMCTNMHIWHLFVPKHPDQQFYTTYKRFFLARRCFSSKIVRKGQKQPKTLGFCLFWPFPPIYRLKGTPSVAPKKILTRLSGTL